jgi:hypothetical protein
MNNLVEKVIKLCDNICKGVYPIEELSVCGGNSVLHFNDICITTYNSILSINVGKGRVEVKINEVEEAKLLIAFNNVLKFSETLVNNTLDELLNVKDPKISNVNELDCDNN